jgi:hypothetical protein
MSDTIYFRLVIFLVILPLASYIVKNIIQNKRDKEFSNLSQQKNKVEDDDKTIVNKEKISEIIENVKVESRLIDTYVHPSYKTTFTDFFFLFFIWFLIGFIIPIYLLHATFKLTWIAVIVSLIVNAFCIYSLRLSLKWMKIKVMIHLYSDKILFSSEYLNEIFEITFSEVKEINLLVERSSGFWPDEFIRIELLCAESFLINDQNITFTSIDDGKELLKIRTLEQQFYHLKGSNNTYFKEEFLKHFGKE